MKAHLKSILYGVSILGGILSYSIQQRVQKINENNYQSFDACETLFGKSCDGTIMSAFSVEWGFSLAAVGLVYFGLIGLLIVFDKKVFTKLALFISAFATGSVLLLTSLLLRTGLSCSICLIIHALIAVSFILIWLKLKYDSATIGTADKKPISKQILHISGIVFILVFGLLSQVYFVGNSEGIEHLKSFDSLSEEYENATVVDFDWSRQAHVIGPADAPIKLVMLSSFQCPGCMTMSSTIKRLKGLYKDDIAINYMHFPLSNQCNSSMQNDMQPQSCSAALAAIAAGKQDKFWEYHDKIFDSGLSLTEEELIGYAQELDLDLAKWNTDQISDETMNKLQADIAKGNSIGVNSTPTIFINGKKAPRIDEAFLRYIIHGILNSED